MFLYVGAKLGPYEILGPLGAGGMGEVYRARDTNLDREVAIKVLPAALAQDLDRLARFKREAKVLASLNHRHIAQIYGVEDSALIMELVEGEAPTGPLSIETALLYSRQIAEALEAAHEKGIVHRDLKPANIKVTPEGVVKVLDFGLAAVAPGPAMDSDPTKSPTMTLAATQAGTVLGTAAYMCPEQAAGKPADKRADIWSFGVVLFELLTGKRLFEGETVSHTLAGVLAGPIDFDRLPHGTPAAIRTLLRRCLDRNPKNRLRDIGEARFAIEAPLAGEAAETAVPLPSTSQSPLLGRRRGSVCSGIRGVGVGAFPRDHAPASALQISDRRAGGRTGHFQDIAGWPVPRHRHSRRVDRAQNLDPIAGRPRCPAVDRCSRPRELYAVLVLGWGATRLPVGGQTVQDRARWRSPGRLGGCARADSTRGLAGWRHHPVRHGQRTFRVSSSGGAPVKLDDQAAESPAWLPNGHFLYVRAGGVFAGALSGGRPVPILPERTAATYVLPLKAGLPGRLLFIRRETLLAQPFDAEKLALQGDAVPVEECQSKPSAGGVAFTASTNGVLVCGGGNPQDVVLTWLDRAGKKLRSVGKPFRLADNPAIRLSPDDSKAIVTISGPTGVDLWIAELNRETLSRFTFEGSRSALWSPDGRRVVWAANDRNRYLKSADGSGKDELLYQDPKCNSCYLEDWSADGKLIAFAESGEKAALDIWLVPVVGDRKPHPYLQSRFATYWAEISPDSRWIAYGSDQSPHPQQVFVASIPAGKGSWQISTEGGDSPIWRRDGKELFYRQGTKLMAVPIRLTETTVDSGEPQVLFEVPSTARFQVSRDGQRFLFALPVEGASAFTPLIVDSDWRVGLVK